MKRISLLSSLVVIILLMAGFTAIGKEKQPLDVNPDVQMEPARKTRIQVAILLDTSGSMDGLIEQAKSRLWNIVNTMTTLKYNGVEPSIQISLYEYGGYNRYDGDYIRRITPFTSDLDLISQELFSLTAGGSEEYCGTVIRKAVRELEWGADEADMKLIYIAGNEVFEQGRVPYKKAIEEALRNNVYVNTIHCGDRMTGIRDFWQDAAIKGKGKFFNINSDATVRYIETPYDDKISECNMRLNDTYISYGTLGREKKINQEMQDNNAKSISTANYAERAVSKSKAIYNNSEWDLVDKVKADANIINEIKEEALPKELQGKSAEEIKRIVDKKTTERTQIQKEINELAVKRQAYIDEQLKKEGDTGADDLGKAITESIWDFAKQKGYSIQ